MTRSAADGGLLAGVRVIEVSSYVATPLCGLVLAQLGAEVIRVEQKGGASDRTRWPRLATGESLYWNGLNGGKRDLEVDLGSAAGRSLVAELVAAGGEGGGILVTNTERWPELRYDALRSGRADLIHVLLTGTGDGRPAVDYTVQAASGFPLVTGPAGGARAVNHVLPAWDLAAGLYVAAGLLAALVRRRERGTGAEIRLALEDVALATAGQLGYLAEAQVEPAPERRADDNFVYGTFGRDFHSADGARFMIVTLTSRQWSDLLEVTGLRQAVDGLAGLLGIDLSDEGDRYRNRRLLAALIDDWFSRRGAAEIRVALAPTRVLWSEYLSFVDIVSDQVRPLRSRPLFGLISQAGVGDLLAPGCPLNVDGRHPAPAPAPAIGQDTWTVLDEHGLSEVMAAALVDAGVLAARKGGS